MESFSIRWENFRGFTDSGWIEVRPLTLFIGPNNSGKTSLLAPLLLLKQTLESRDRNLGLVPRGELTNAGTYKEFIHNHDSSLPLTLSLRFRPRRRTKPNAGTDPDDLVNEHATTASFTFGPSEDGRNVLLTRYELYGRRKARLLLRELLPSGNYSLPGFSQPRGRPRSDADVITSRIRSEPPDHFLFTLRSITPILINEALSAINRRRGRSTKDVSIEMPELAVFYTKFVGEIESAVRSLLRRVTYIGPLREPPRRHYELSAETPRGVGMRGEFAPELLYRGAQHAGTTEVRDWLRRFGFGTSLQFDESGPSAFSVIVRRRGAPSVNLADTGFGISQVLPFLVQAVIPEERLVIAEQPEIHLNPRLQGTLGDLFAGIVAGGGIVLAETHSEHLVLRLRRLIAETKATGERGLRARDVALYYVESGTKGSSVTPIPIEDDGAIDPEKWPRGFFEDALREALGLAEAQANI